jgi:hypothetical protein
MSFGSGKIKPEDLFVSLRVMQQESENSINKSVSEKFFNRFKHRFTEEVTFDG